MKSDRVEEKKFIKKKIVSPPDEEKAYKEQEVEMAQSLYELRRNILSRGRDTSPEGMGKSKVQVNPNDASEAV